MKRLRRLLYLHQRDRQLLASATILLLAIRLGLWLLPFQTLRQLLATLSQKTYQLENLDQTYVGKIVWAVDVASRYMPGGVKCLARALATQVLLHQRGHSAELRIGVAKGDGKCLEAHAWIESQGKIVSGGLKDLYRYTPLPLLQEQK